MIDEVAGRGAEAPTGRGLRELVQIREVPCLGVRRRGRSIRAVCGVREFVCQPMNDLGVAGHAPRGTGFLPGQVERGRERVEPRVAGRVGGSWAFFSRASFTRARTFSSR